MKERLLVIMVVLAFGLLAGCPSEALPGLGSDNDNLGPDAPRVAPITITMEPNRLFNNAPIEITLGTLTDDAIIRFTLDGTAPTATSTLYTGPFQLDFSTVNVPRRGFIRLQAVGMREGHHNSVVLSRDFQVFEPALFGNVSETRSGTGPGFYPDGETSVSITLTNGNITGVSMTTGGAQPDTASYWERAAAHATEFLSLMNHWNFDALAGATGTSENIRSVAQQILQPLE